MERRTRVHGVDFSGAMDAGRRIWIASGVVAGDYLRVESCRPAETLPGAGRGREAALAALRAFIAGEQEGVFGLDFPFALPAALMPEPAWKAWALAFASRYPDADAFRAACLAVGGGRERWRQTDRQTRTPFPAYNLRIYRQTFYGVRDLLAPLVGTDRASVLPMQPPAPNRAWLLEICPAATLKQMGLYQPYKGAAPGRRETRARILAALEADALCLASPKLRAAFLDNAGGDALDSVVAAVTVGLVLRKPELLAVAPESVFAREGCVYLPAWSPDSLGSWVPQGNAPG